VRAWGTVGYTLTAALTGVLIGWLGAIVFVPLSLVLSVLLTWQGVPSTFDGAKLATPIDTTTGMKEQKIPVGPVAPMVAIKQLGTNGGGWYGPNSAVALENPTPFSNLLQTLAIILIPVAIPFMVGPVPGPRRFRPLLSPAPLGLAPGCGETPVG